MTAATTGRQGAVPVPDSDAELWARGDKAAFTVLFDRHAEAVWNHAYRLTASWSLAEDLTSATFLAAWRRRADITLIRDSALPWLYTSVSPGATVTDAARCGLGDADVRFSGCVRPEPSR